MYINPFNKKKRCFVSHELILLAGKLSPFEFIVKTAWNSVCCFLCRKCILLHLSTAYLNSPSWRWPGPNTFSTNPFRNFDFSSTSSCLSCSSGIVSLMSYISRSATRGGWGDGEVSGDHCLWKSSLCVLFSGWGGKPILSEVAFCGVT